MTDYLLAPQTAALAFQALTGLVAGLLIGLVHFSTLKWNLQFFTGGQAGKALGLQLLRLSLLGTVLGLLAIFGAMALLSGMLGLLFGRRIVLRRARSLP